MITGRPGAGRGGWWIAMMLVAVALVFDLRLGAREPACLMPPSPGSGQPARATGPSSLPSMRRGRRARTLALGPQPAWRTGLTADGCRGRGDRFSGPFSEPAPGDTALRRRALGLQAGWCWRWRPGTFGGPGVPRFCPPELAVAAAALGHVDVELDADALVRRTYRKAGSGARNGRRCRSGVRAGPATRAGQGSAESRSSSPCRPRRWRGSA